MPSKQHQGGTSAGPSRAIMPKSNKHTNTCSPSSIKETPQGPPRQPCQTKKNKTHALKAAHWGHGPASGTAFQRLTNARSETSIHPGPCQCIVLHANLRQVPGRAVHTHQTRHKTYEYNDQSATLSKKTKHNPSKAIIISKLQLAIISSKAWRPAKLHAYPTTIWHYTKASS